MVQPERKILWHPTCRNRFVVGGGNAIGQIKVFDWDGKSDISEVTALGDLQHMKCFALSPHPLNDDLIAVGNSLGKVELMRFSAPHPPNAVRSPSIADFPVRTSRACNALAFSHFDPNYLAVGLDKVRGDPSLVIWDIEVATSSLPRSKAQDQTKISRPQPLLPRSVRGEKGPLQHWVQSEVITSLAFLPNTASLLVAGVSHRSLRLFDLRMSFSSTNPQSTVTKSVYGISMDPFDPNRLACFGDDGTVRIWDHRRFSTPILTFTERDAIADGANPRSSNPINAIEFSRSRRGTLATMEKDAVIVRFWDTVRATFPEDGGILGKRLEPAQEEIHASKISKLARLPWTSSTTESQSPVVNEKPVVTGEQIILRNTRTTAPFSQPLSSFVCIPGNPSRINEFSLAVVTKDGDLDMQTLYDPPLPQWSSRGEFSITSGRSYWVYQPFRDEVPVPDPWTVVPQEQSLSIQTNDSGLVRERPQSSKEAPRNAPEEILLSVRPPSPVHNSSSRRRFTPEKSAAPDATPRPGHLLLRPDNEPTEKEKRGRMYQKVGPGLLSRSQSRGRLPSDERSSRLTIVEDMSMVIRRRVLGGYGLENIVHNAQVARSEVIHEDEDNIAELWQWLESSRILLPHVGSRIHGFEFSNQGVLGIWEGFQPVEHTSSLEGGPDISTSTNRDLEPSSQSLPVEDSDGYHTPNRQRKRRSLRRSHSPIDQLHGDFAAAVHVLNTRRGYDRASSARIPASTARLAQRRFCLTLCGWNQGDDELLKDAARWEKEGHLTRASCWLLFTGHYDKAIECLMRSDDERLRIMSGTLAALVPQRGTSNQLREHYNRLIVRIEDPYLRVMLTHIALEDWIEVLQEESLPLQERLAIAFRFLDDRSLSSYLRQLTERFRTHGVIAGLILTGLTPVGFDVLQGYVDKTGDVQTAAIFAALVCPGTFRDARADRWLEAYRSLLDGWKLFHHRCQFDISRGRLIKEAVAREDIPAVHWVPPQLAVKCGFCNKAINARGPMVGPGGRTRVNCCQSCGRSLPRCSVCLMTLGFASDLTRDAGPTASELKDIIDDAIVFCQTCKHGGHVSHVLEWFFGSNSEDSGEQSHKECPVANCDCRCTLE